METGCGWWRLLHWGPLTAIAIIKWIILVTLYCNTMWYPPADSILGFLYTSVFLMFSGLTMYHFFLASFIGPGYLPLGWTPVNKTGDVVKQLQQCTSCQGYKAPRAHHCRKCARCVMKMDHHCPWINNCVGHFNHGHFTAFLGSAVCGCFLSCISLSSSLYYGLNRSWYEYYGSGREPRVILTIWSLLATLIGLGLAIGVVIAVGLLFFFQIRSILRNQTGIEDWIVEKANFRHRHSEKKFVFPYNLGRWKNFHLVINSSCTPKGDGISWDVVEGADDYTLTREQLCQKADKRDRAREYEIIHDYSGAWFPISQGLYVCCRPPCTDEPRISLTRGDKVNVTRWKKYWLYGDKITQLGQERVRGWFPRRIGVEVVVHDPYCHLAAPQAQSSPSTASIKADCKVKQRNKMQTNCEDASQQRQHKHHSSKHQPLSVGTSSSSNAVIDKKAQ